VTAVATRISSAKSTYSRRLPVGAETQPGGGVHFRLWAPRCQRARLQINSSDTPFKPIEMTAESGGYYSAFCREAAAGDRYWFLLDGEERKLPDPASRFQPEGPHGPSEIIDPSEYAWNDAAWRGVKLPGQVIYEMHIGTFTSEGTWAAAALQLAELADAGITLIEIMPVAGVPGRFNWGYDGVNLFAPTVRYGRPDEMRQFVDAAHRQGIGVILDVVYNHLGPDGNYLGSFAPQYFTDLHETDWGAALNFYGAGSGPVREFFIHNAGYWIEEFHLDGLRLDATQNIYDESDDHVVAALTRQARAKAGQRSIVVIGENEPQEAHYVRSPEQAGYGIDGLWNDDFHHAALVALRGRNEAYYSDYKGCAQELLSAAKYGYLYQGQWSQWQGKRRGTPARDIPPWAFVTFLENHDQVSNSLRGQRIHQLSSPGRCRALTALLLLGPGTPMLFQGQEFGASAPFLFFADHHQELAPLVHKGRKEFLTQFPSIDMPDSQALIDDPASEATFRKCCLNLSERKTNDSVYRMHKDLLRLRKAEKALAPRERRWYDGAVLSEQAFALRYFGDDEADDRLLIVNLGTDLRLCILPEPLLAAPLGMRWDVKWSSEDIDYGGCGTPKLIMDNRWRILGEAALWLAPQVCSPEECSDG
jgi:maltooligosyltrehalose trehalohydrolase